MAEPDRLVNSVVRSGARCRKGSKVFSCQSLSDSRQSAGVVNCLFMLGVPRISSVLRQRRQSSTPESLMKGVKAVNRGQTASLECTLLLAHRAGRLTPQQPQQVAISARIIGEEAEQHASCGYACSGSLGGSE